MALVVCKECNKEVSDKAFSCPNCGYPLSIADISSVPPPIAENVEDRLSDKQKKHTPFLAPKARTSTIRGIVATIGVIGFLYGVSSLIKTAVPPAGMSDYNEGVKLMTEGSNELAEQCFKTALQKNPSSGEAHLNLGIIYMNRGWADGAEQSTVRAIRLLEEAGKTSIGGSTLNQTLALCYNNLGWIEMNRVVDAENRLDITTAKKHWQKGMVSFQRAITLDPGCSVAQGNLVRYRDAY